MIKYKNLHITRYFNSTYNSCPAKKLNLKLWTVTFCN